MAAIGGKLAPAALRAFRIASIAAKKASKVIRIKITDATKPISAALEPAFVRASPARQPIHPAALLRQQKSGRYYSTSSFNNINAAVRRFISTAQANAGIRVDRSQLYKTQAGRCVAQLTGRAPFASTFRPNLTGGALPRTAGGYGLGSGRMGSARYFSHAPAAPAQVMQNVSVGMRAFLLSGQKVQYDGVNARGEKQYRAVSALRDETSRKLAALPRNVPGSFVDFHLNPTVTAFSPLAAAFPYPSGGIKASAVAAPSLNEEGFLDVLSVDFARALKDLTATLSDIQKLASLGDLPVCLEDGHKLRVKFPGVDAETLEILCDDLGLTRGLVGEDADFEADNGVTMALKFPFAPQSSAATVTSPGGSLRSEDSFHVEEFFEEFDEMVGNPWLSSPEPEGYASMSPPLSSIEHTSEDYEGMEGIYKFLEECDRARGRFY